MADAPYIQGRIYYGYGKAAAKLGLPFTFYRASSPINPIVPANIIGSIRVSLNQSWDYMKANKYGNAVWQMLGDARQPPDSIGFTIGDYFSGQSLDGNFISNEDNSWIMTESGGFIELENNNLTYFVISKQLILPILAVECNKIIKIERATQDNSPDSDDYSGYVQESATLLASNFPVSILMQAIGRDNKQKLPTDTLMPRWTMLMPNLGDVEFKNRDLVTDELGFRYVLAGAEKTDFGWRCGIELLGT